MEAIGVVVRQPLLLPSSIYYASSSKEVKTSSTSSMLALRGRRHRASGILASGYGDQVSLQYYGSKVFPSSAARRMTVLGGKLEIMEKNKAEKKKKKKALKLLEGLSRDLATFSRMGFGLEYDDVSVSQEKGEMMTEAAELLLKQLQELRANEKELKRKMKEEKARSKAANMQNIVVDCESSASSSSSESSDSECEEEVVDTNSLKLAQGQQNGNSQLLEKMPLSNPALSISSITLAQSNISEANQLPLLSSTTLTEDLNMLVPSSSQMEINCLSRNDGRYEKMGSVGEEIGKVSSFSAVSCSTKIEVCMGGKCKKSGAGALLEEFERVVGIEGAVSGCKCMGKCKQGPNVKVLNEFDGGVGEKSVGASEKSICVGVGLEDVGAIVKNFLGENQDSIGYAAAC